jgi:hypothetical protein
MFTINLDGITLSTQSSQPRKYLIFLFELQSAPLVVFWHNSRFQSHSFAIFQGVTIGAVIMATVTLKIKSISVPGNFEYTFECFCSPKPLKEIKAFGDIHYQQERRLIFRNTNARSPIQRVFEPAFLPFLDLERSGPGRLAFNNRIIRSKLWGGGFSGGKCPESAGCCAVTHYWSGAITGPAAITAVLADSN